jgi:general secretion pathway protein H
MDAVMRGFALLEILIVVAIVAIASSALVVRAWPDGGASAEHEARRLAALLESAHAEARASGRAIAWSPEGNGYAFLRRTEGGTWERFPEDTPWRSRQLEAGVALRGERAVLLPYGLAGAFEAAIAGGSTRIILRSELLGRVSLERIHAR